MVHISEVANTYVKEIRDFVSENQTVKVKILNIGDDGKISLSMKGLLEGEEVEPDVKEYKAEGEASTSLADLLSGIQL